MSLSKNGPKLLVICLLATGLLTLWAGPAKGEEGAFWTVQKLKISTFLSPELSIEPPGGKPNVAFLGSIGSIKFNILCNVAANAAFESHLLEPNGAVSIKFHKFTGCIFKKIKKETIEEELKFCEPHEGAEKGVLLIAPLKGLITLGGETNSILSLEPAEGTTFFNIEMSEECAFGEKMSFGGKLGLKDSQSKFSTEQETHELEEDPTSTKLFVNNKESNTAHVDLKLRFSFSGLHKALFWSGHPG